MSIYLFLYSDDQNSSLGNVDVVACVGETDKENDSKPVDQPLDPSEDARAGSDNDMKSVDQPLDPNEDARAAENSKSKNISQRKSDDVQFRLG